MRGFEPDMIIFVIVSVADAGRASRRQQAAFVSDEMEGTAIHGEASRAACKNKQRMAVLRMYVAGPSDRTFDQLDLR
ncbi:hypothetical protein ABD76_01975 [Paenibacillus dendritiformis]|nr:hypothetical protein [Paenibacillus dendritiformis]